MSSSEGEEDNELYANLDSSDSSASDSEEEITSSDEEDGDESLRGARRWYQLPVDNLQPAPPPFPFTGDPGLSILGNVSEMNPLDFFSLFITDELVDLVCRETNKFATQTAARDVNWRPVTSSEMYVFFALNMLGGIIKTPDLEMQWSKHHLLQQPIYGSIMPLKRYLKIKQYLHFVDNQTYDEENHPNPKLHKIYDVYSMLQEKFQSVYTPERDVSIDESLMLYKGRLGWVQYIPMKRSRFGIKYYMLCESSSGYVWKFMIYVGKGTQISQEYPNLNMAAQIVMDLMKPLLRKGYRLTIDNFYTYPELVDILVQNYTDVLGTIRLNRKQLPDKFKKEKLKKGQVRAVQRGKVMALRWRDKKDVAMISTVHNPAMVDVSTPRQEKIKPQVVVDYNFTMGGVDKVDQHMVDYPIPRKRGKKYYKKVFFHLMDLALWNSYLLYVKSFENLEEPTSSQLTHLKYRLELIDSLIRKHHPEIPRARVGRPSTPHPTRGSSGHYPMDVPATEKKKFPTRKCAQCAKKRDGNGKKVRKETRYLCKICQVPLCVTPCFEAYHTE